ncbi:MAG: YgiQ family radical SAM protein [Atribacterota bacterium]|nr:YgiQ family radical SAM protein [Atribacterota bacterium]
MYLPTTREEMVKLSWEKLDIIIVTGDTYIDSPYMGISVIGKILLKAGYRVGIIAQPDINSPDDICRLGEPCLFWGVTAGSVDSMIANYTATGKKRKKDDYTPGGINNRRPDRATIVYVNLIKRYFKNTCPIVLGGIEASLRRIAHYDFWDDCIRRSILFDSKADILVYGMAENSILELTKRLAKKESISDIRGICYISDNPVEKSILLPSFSEVKQDKEKFIQMFHLFYQNQDPFHGKILAQQQDNRYLIHNPPSFPLSTKKLDKIYEIDYENDVHPFYFKDGPVRAMDTIKFSVTSHRGCFGECNFCAITVHQGKYIQSRSEKSIINEIKQLATDKDFKGYILDVGGPTANMYGMGCSDPRRDSHCLKKRCLFPVICNNLALSHQPQMRLLRKIRKIKGIKKIFVASGIRYDLVVADKKNGTNYLREIIQHHISGQLKIAPEHIEKKVLSLMGKGDNKYLSSFKKLFDRINRQTGQKQYLTYYFIAAHPGCREKDMILLKQFIQKELHIYPEQVQIFIPTPSTYSSVMYYTGMDPFTGDNIFVEKKVKNKEKQKKLIIN